MSFLSDSVSEFPYPIPGEISGGIAWSRCGTLIAVPVGCVLQLFRIEEKFELIYSVSYQDSLITSVSWASGPNVNGQTPFWVLVAHKNGETHLIDVESNTIIAGVTSKDDYIISSTWSSLNAFEFFTGTFNGKLHHFEVDATGMNITLVQTLQFTSPINFLSFSPHYEPLLLAGSRNGKFFLYNPHNPQEILVERRLPNLTNITFCKFVQMFHSAIIYGSNGGVYIYYLYDNASFCLLGSDIAKDNLIDIFPSNSDPLVYFCVHQGFIRLLILDNTPIDQMPIQLLSSSSAFHVLSCSAFGDSLAIHTGSNSIVLFEVHDRLLHSRYIYCGIQRRPTAIRCSRTSLTVGFNGQYIDLMRNNLRRIVDEGIVCGIENMDEDVFLVTVVLEVPVYKVLAVNRKLHKVQEIQKPIVSSHKPYVFRSYDHKHFGILIDGSVIILFKDPHYPKHYATLIRPHGTLVAFSDTQAVLWIYRPDKRLEQHLIGNSLTYTSATPLGGVWDKATSFTVMQGICIFGLEDGGLMFYNDEQRKLKQFVFMKAPIQALEVSPQNNSCFAIDNQGNVGYFSFSRNGILSQLLAEKIEQIAWIDDSWVVAQFPNKNSISIVYATDLITKKAFKPLKLRKELTEMDRNPQAMRQSGFYLLADLLESQQKSIRAPCFCCNFKAEAKTLLHTYYRLIGKEKIPCLRTRSLHLSLLDGDIPSARDIFLKANQASPQFGSNVILGGFLGCNVDEAITAQVEETLLSGGNRQDAIDFLFVVGSFSKVERLLLEDRNFEEALCVRMAKLEDDDLIDETAAALAHTSVIMAAGFLLAQGEPVKAAQWLEIQTPLRQTGAMLRALCEE